MRVRLHPADSLIQILQGQRDVYAALIALYRKHQDDLANWNLLALKPLLAEEQKRARELAVLEQRRLGAVTRLMMELGFQPPPHGEQLSHSQLLEHLGLATEDLDEAAATRKRCQDLEKLGRELRIGVQMLAELREPLQPLLQSALGFLDRNNPDGNSMYGARGQSDPTTTPRRIDRKV